MSDRRRHGTRNHGFTLIELLVTLAVIGILAAAAIPNLSKHAFKAKRSEAYGNLRAIRVAQLAHKAELGVFADTFDELGVDIGAGTQLDEHTVQARHYTYVIMAIPGSGGRPRQNFRTIATGDIDPTDAVLDILVIENELTVDR